MDYSDLFRELTFELKTVVFLKRDGTVRVMLCTRDLELAEMVHGFKGYALGGYDNRCNIKNGNMAVIDMVIGEARSFNIERVLGVESFGQVGTMAEFEKALGEFAEYAEEYEKSKPMKLDMSMLK